MCYAQYQIAVRDGGDLTGASILLTCEKDGLHEIELEVLDCIMDDDDVRIYVARECGKKPLCKQPDYKKG